MFEISFISRIFLCLKVEEHVRHLSIADTNFRHDFVSVAFKLYDLRHTGFIERDEVSNLYRNMLVGI